MALNDLERFRMVAKIMLQQQGDDIEQGMHKHIVPQIYSIDINPKNPQLALVANYQSLYFIDATSPDLQDRIVQQYPVPPDYFIKQAIFCPSVQYKMESKIGWKPDIMIAIMYEGQRFIHVMDPETSLLAKIMLPFVPLYLISPQSISKDITQNLPQPLVALGQQEFTVIAIQDYHSFTGYNEIFAQTNSYKIPVFAAADDPLQASFGEDPSTLFILNGNYFYRYYISLIASSNEHATDNQLFQQHVSEIKLRDPVQAELCTQLIRLERAFARPGKCQLKGIYKLNMERVLQFKFSHNFQYCAFMTARNVQVFRFAENKLLNSLLVSQDFVVFEDNLEFIPYIPQVESTLPDHFETDIDIFAEPPVSDCSVISDDIEVSSGQEFKQLLEKVDDNLEVKGWFDYYLVKSQIINKQGKAQLLVNVLKQHPHLYAKFRQMYKENCNSVQKLQQTVENFGQQMIFTEDDTGILVRPNVFSGFCVFELNERQRQNVKIWQPVNTTSVQDFQSKHCATFVSGQNIFLLGVGNALYFSAIY